MQMIGQNHDGLDGKWSASAGRPERLLKVVNVFGQEFPAAFQQPDSEEESAAWNKSANILRHKSGLNQLPKAGGLSFSRPTATEGGMRCAFPPYAKIRTSKFPQYIQQKSPAANSPLYFITDKSHQSGLIRIL